MLRVRFYLNRDLVTAEVPVELSALEFLREWRGLTGVKEVCNEGDCGACTVALGRYTHGRVVYRAVNSCLLPVARLHGRHVVTAEGLAEGERLHPVQQALVDQHAIQCGYCTPGMVMALFCLFVEQPRPSPEEILAALEGTLCRCTGYAAIHAAAQSLAVRPATDSLESQDIRPAYFAEIAQALSKRIASPEPIMNGDAVRYHWPQNLDTLFEELNQIHEPETYCLLGGGTDTVVETRFKGRRATHWCDLAQIAELNALEITATHLRIGANVTLAELLESPLPAAHFPALAQCVAQMSSAQIRNVATLVGNVCTASPIADALPPLLVYQAEVVLQTRDDTHRLPLSGFLLGYRKTALCPREIVTAIEIPLHRGWSRFEKTGKRRALDIASVNSALALTLKGNRLSDVRLAFGGVAPTTVFARKTAAFLSGKMLTDALIAEAAELAVTEIQPISDVRGSAAFRRLLTRNHVIKHLTCLLETL